MSFPKAYQPVKKLTNLALREWKKDKRCVICGARVVATKEHTPPQGIFFDPGTPLITVKGCGDCQKTPDKAFKYLLINACTNKPPTDIIKREAFDFRTKYETDKSLRRVLRDARGEVLYGEDPLSSSRVHVPLRQFNWLVKLHDPIILKTIAGCYWLFTCGKILADIPSNIVVLRDYDPSLPYALELQKVTFPAINIGDGQFIATHIQGFEKPYDEIMILNFHFHCDGDPTKGYHVSSMIIPTALQELLPVAKEYVSMAKESTGAAMYKNTYFPDLER